MSLFNFRLWLVGPKTINGPESESSSVRDELMFHFRELVKDNVAAGDSFDAAWEKAEKQFGSVRYYENECKIFQLRTSIVKQVALSAIVLFMLLCAGWSRFELGTVRLNRELSLLKERIESLRPELVMTAQSANEVAEPQNSDLIGQVLDADKRPLPDATVLIILKIWPYDQYRQEDFVTRTDAEGHFAVPQLIPASSRYAVEVTAVKEQFAFRSYFHLRQTPEEKPEPISLQLEPSSSVTLVVRDEKGTPIPNVKVVPMTRESASGERHCIYFQGSDPVRQTTDDEGRVHFDCFQTGDTVEISVQQPGREWDIHSFEVSADDFTVDLASTAVALN